MSESFPKIGLALGSGGAKGLAHIGVLKALEKAGINIDFIAGSSIGALIGAYYAAHPTFSELEEFVLSMNRRKGFALFDPSLRGGLIKGNKFEKLIADLLGKKKFEALRIPFSAVATDFNTAEEVVLDSGDLAKVVRASISVPAVFRPVEYESKILADGGLSNPVPVSVVRKMGADIVIAVNVEPSYFYKPVESLPPLTGIPAYSVNILRHNLTFQSLKNADFVISPDTLVKSLVGWNYFFDAKKAGEIIKAGEKATEDAIPEIRKVMERFEKPEKEGFFSRIKKLFTF